MVSLGQRIRAARLSYGMSQAELARRVHISKTAMNDIEQDRTADPGFSIVERIADALSIRLDKLAKKDTPASSHAAGEG
jgi:transcriptional regulator with XRE-family HTH domain